MSGVEWLRVPFLAAMISCVSCMVCPSESVAEVILSTSMLDAGQAVPSTNSDALGVAILALDTDTDKFNFDLFVSGIPMDELRGAGPNSSPIHLHNAAKGVSGPIVVDVGFLGDISEFGGGFRLEVTDKTFGGEQGGLNTDIAKNISDLLAGELYVNIHTNASPGGEIRGQVAVAVPEPGTIVLALMGLVGLAAYGWRRRRSA